LKVKKIASIVALNHQSLPPANWSQVEGNVKYLANDSFPVLTNLFV